MQRQRPEILYLVRHDTYLDILRLLPDDDTEVVLEIFLRIEILRNLKIFLQLFHVHKAVQ